MAGDAVLLNASATISVASVLVIPVNSTSTPNNLSLIIFIPPYSNNLELCSTFLLLIYYHMHGECQ